MTNTNVNGEWQSSDQYRDVTHSQNQINTEPAKIIDMSEYRSKE